jgi:hypothetical protein
VLIAVLKEDHEVTGDDGCSASWVAGSQIAIGPDASLDYVRKGVLVSIGEVGHLHVIPASILSFYIDSGGSRFPVGGDALLKISG